LINPNVKELLDAVERVLNDPEFMKKISENAVQVAAAFDKKIWINRWEKIIEKQTKKA
jgi:glycosyltransferase involved in cell wall biosynthesis